MIKLTLMHNGRKVLVNPEMIACVLPRMQRADGDETEKEDGALVAFPGDKDGEYLHTRETVDEIWHKLMEE